MILHWLLGIFIIILDITMKKAERAGAHYSDYREVIKSFITFNRPVWQ